MDVYKYVNKTANTISTGEKPFMTFCDMHYRTTGLPTKNATPNFWE